MGYLVLLVVSAPVIIPQFMGFLDVFDISEIFHKPEVSWRPWPAPEDLHNFHRTAELNLEIQGDALDSIIMFAENPQKLMLTCCLKNLEFTTNEETSLRCRPECAWM